MAQGLHEKHGKKADHGETTIDALRVATPAESGDITRRRRGCLVGRRLGRLRWFGLGGHQQSDAAEFIVCRGQKTPSSLAVELENRVVELTQGGPVTNTHDRHLPLH